MAKKRDGQKAVWSLTCWCHGRRHEAPWHKKYIVTHLLLIMQQDVMRLNGRKKGVLSLTYCHGMMRCDWLHGRMKGKYHTHPVGHRLTWHDRRNDSITHILFVMVMRLPGKRKVESLTSCCHRMRVHGRKGGNATNKLFIIECDVVRLQHVCMAEN